MSEYLKKSVGWLLVVLTCLVGVNYFGDSANIFHDDFEQQLAAGLAKGDMVSYRTNYDERRVQELIADKLKDPPSTLVLGSSRMMLVGGADLNDVRLRNAAVSSAVIQDLVGIYQLYRERGLLPQKLVIGVDPWIFNAKYNVDRWRTLQEYYWSFWGRSVDQQPLNWWNIRQLFSLTYFQSSAKTIFTRNKAAQEIIEVEQEENKYATRRPDGSLVYDEKKRGTSVEKAKQEARQMKNDETSLVGFSQIDTMRWKEFLRFLEVVKNDEVDIELVLIPYHPTYYAETAYREQILTVERKLGSIKYATLSGSYDPDYVGAGEADFYDALHARKEVVVKSLHSPVRAGER